ncbi:Outer membrane lipoprotein-sorting protein [Halapricum desulfuricans]|uniref:Outer membrane lipoprotein-sorting protein n=1 Tax=Halapricum desulfuricans TaxID=2841257 RepID=A0A897NJR9_9EURY|nr:Outer membrane lipoprotein-sorting protein [Halapricum desulfuricans]
MSSASDVPFRALLLLFAVVLVALSGCAALDSQQTEFPTAGAVEETLADLEAVNATVVSSLDGSRVSEQQIAFEVGTQRRRSTTQVGETESLVVANDSVTWRYDRAANTVQVTRRSDRDRQSNASISRSMASIFGRLNAGSDDSEQKDVLEPLILPSAGAGGQQPFSGPVERFENASLRYLGTGTVADREAYVVEVVPQPDVNTANITLWIDKEWYYPLQWDSTIVVDGERRTVTTAYRNVTFNPEIPADTFRFEPPANATVVERTVVSRSFETRGELVAASEMTIPDPDVPEPLTFDSARYFDDNGTVRTSLQYTNGSATLRVTKSEPIGDSAPLPEGNRVEINDHEGVIQTFESGTSLVWSCEGYRYTVFGDVPAETVHAVGKSINCG